ncbi:MAG: D-tyrosyl-tRNA(Tyr) deacylase [Clostridia bacterium]|nr:D-tyrosyl-tRNA(Tyr) deacylase [Clostridia bacterium]
MIAVLQRVHSASVVADGTLSGEIKSGLYILLGVAEGDAERDAEVLAEKISKLRIFSDENGKMNLSVKDIGGEVLVVSNFTLLANYAHGNRPDYLGSAAPTVANSLYQHFVCEMGKRVEVVKTGVFGADMQTKMETDGPVTIVMNSSVLLKKG